MRLRLYLVLLGAALALVGVSAVGTQAPPVPKSWRALGAIQPRLSPDGESVACAYQGAIWRLPLAGGGMRRLTAEPSWDSNPAWSPDGKKIAFLSAGILLLIDADTGAPAAMAARVAARGSLWFHPDGKRLLAGCRSGNGFAISWVDLATGGVTPALDPPADARVFALSPDGASIAVVTHQDVPGEQGGHNGPEADVWIDGKKLVRFPSRIFDLAWNGASLVAVSDAGGAHNDLWEIPLASPANARRLTSGQADEDAPSVAAGRLLYTDNREGATALVARELASGDEGTVRVSGLDFGKPAGVLSLEIVEKGTNRPLVARVALQQDGGKPAAPPGSLYRIHDGQMDFTADRTATLSVPAGRYHVHVSRGPEYRLAHPQADVAAGATTKFATSSPSASTIRRISSGVQYHWP